MPVAHCELVDTRHYGICWFAPVSAASSARSSPPQVCGMRARIAFARPTAGGSGDRVDRVVSCNDQRVGGGERELREVALADAEAGGQGLVGERAGGGAVADDGKLPGWLIRTRPLSLRPGPLTQPN